jgi:hypothetical protein
MLNNARLELNNWEAILNKVIFSALTALINFSIASLPTIASKLNFHPFSGGSLSDAQNIRSESSWLDHSDLRDRSIITNIEVVTSAAPNGFGGHRS